MRGGRSEVVIGCRDLLAAVSGAGAAGRKSTAARMRRTSQTEEMSDEKIRTREGPFDDGEFQPVVKG